MFIRKKSIAKLIVGVIILMGIAFLIGGVVLPFDTERDSVVETRMVSFRGDFTEKRARDVLFAAVRYECNANSKSARLVDYSLADAVVANVPGRRVGESWVFRYGDPEAIVTTSGVVSGDLLKNLGDRCYNSRYDWVDIDG